ncbi:MAG: TonB-dependent receptor [Desulfobacteraceae bacterium]|nr:TonB-dependent receptor [Desulfobacteraceae bacterium]
MQYSPGTFHWKRTSINEPHPFVLMRGFRGSNRNLTLMDGMTINYPPSLTTNWMSVPMMTVERIEEVRGPFSSLYGGSAMGGVVNFITKTPDKQEIRAKVSYGTFDTLIAQAAYGDRFMDKFSLLLSYEGRRTDGYPSRIVKGSSTSGKGTTPVTGWQTTRDVLDTKDIYILGDRGDEDNNENNIFGKLSFDITAKSNLSFSINHYEKDFEFGDYNTYLRDAYGNPVDSGSVSFLNQKIDLTPGTFLMGTGNTSRKQTRYIAKYTNKFAEGSSLEVLLGANDTPESVSNSPGSSILSADGAGIVSETDSEAYFSEVKLNLPIGNRNFITSGVSYEQMSSKDAYYTLSNWKNTDSKTAFTQSSKGKTENIGIYIQDEISIFSELTAYLGARYDLYRISDGEVVITDPAYIVTSYEAHTESQFSPKLSLHYRPFSDTVFRGSVGTSFRGPMIGELFKKSFHNPNIWMYGNPELEPETAVSWELGVVQNFLNRKTTFAATYFESYVDNLINDVPTAYDPVVGTVIEQKTQNIGKAEIRGVEAEIRHKFTDYLSGFANFTWTDAKTKEHPTNKAAEGKQITLIPEYMANAGLNFSMNNFDVSLTNKYVSKIYSREDNLDTATGVPEGYDEVFLTDFKVGYKFTQWTKISFSINDLFDQGEYYNYKVPGRRVMASMEITF